MIPSTNAYLSQQLAGASPAKRVAMLHDRAISALREAVEAIAQGDIQRRWKANNKAGEIIEALWMTLDTERGGEIAANLDRLYSFMLRQLANVDLRNDPKPAEEVIGLLEPLRRSWHELVHNEETTAASAAPRGAGRPGDDRPDSGPGGEPMRSIVLSA